MSEQAKPPWGGDGREGGREGGAGFTVGRSEDDDRFHWSIGSRAEVLADLTGPLGGPSADGAS